MIPFDEEVDVLPPAKAISLSSELREYVLSLKGFFGWLRQPENAQVAEHFSGSMVSSGGTVSQFMLQMFEAEDQLHFPWSMLDDPYVIRTAAGKVSAWLNGGGANYGLDLGSAKHLRAYQS